ncbi:MAG: glutaredoxin family protein [Candidatus Thorarchaeota archaeon]
MTKVVIYTAPECPHSKKLKEFLADVGVEVEEKCILADPETLAELIEVSAQRAIPTTVLGDDVFVGFDRRTERRLKRKMEA